MTFKITHLIFLFVIGLFRFSISSWVSFGGWCLSKKFSISFKLSNLLAYSSLQDYFLKKINKLLLSKYQRLFLQSTSETSTVAYGQASWWSQEFTVSLLPQLVEYLVLGWFLSPPCYKSLLLFSGPSLSQPLALADAPQSSRWSDKEVGL